MKLFLPAYTDEENTYIFQVTEVEGAFLFYRQDGAELKDIGTEPIDMYHNYICAKLFPEGTTSAVYVYNDFKTKMSRDNRCLLLMTKEMDLDLDENNNIVENVEASKKVNPVNRMIKSVFGKK